jgi:ABC-type Mn2+/Zn2+ transport system ATPase subunit
MTNSVRNSLETEYKQMKSILENPSEKNKCILFSTHDIDLCIEENIPVLLIEQATQQLIQKNELMTKVEILLKGFNLK